MFYGWRVVALTMYTQALQAGLLIYSFSLLVLPFTETFHASRQTVMLAPALLSLFTNLISPFAGNRVDRASIRTLMLAGLAALALGLTLIALCQDFWPILAVFALVLPFGNLLLGQLTSAALIANWFSELRGRAMGLSAVGTSLGGLALPPLLAALIGWAGWRAALLVLAGVAVLVGWPLVRGIVVNRPEDRGLLPDGRPVASGRSGTSDATRGVEGRDWQTAEILRTARFWIIAVVMGIALSMYITVLSNLVPYAIDRGITASAAAGLVSLLAFCGIAGKLAFGVAADRLDLRHAMGLAIVLMIAGLALLITAPGYGRLAAGCVALGGAAGGLLPVWGNMVARGFGRRSFGRALGLMNPAMMPITLAGPPLTGRVYDLTGSYDPAFEIFIGALVIAGLLLLALRWPGGETSR